MPKALPETAEQKFAGRAPPTHRCPRCDRETREDQLGCTRCWFALPLELRREVMRLFKAKRGSPAHKRAVVEAVRLMRAARAADLEKSKALAAATTPPPSKQLTPTQGLELELAADDA